MIPQETVQKIIDTSRIEEVIADFISLRKKGTNYTGLCPFHNEKTPSFMVSPAKGIFKCFGCGKGGNSVNFVMEHEHITYVESLKFLAKKYNIEVQETELTADELKKKNNRESLLVITTHAQKYFSKTIPHTPEGKAIGLSYFKERKFRDDIIEKFQLGYSLNEKDAYTQEALKNGFKIDYLEQTGLTIVKDNYNTDRFRGRVIFPIHTLSGQVIGFGGRILKQDPEKKLAKYLNSPQSEIYDKSNTLYGIFYAKKSIVQQDKCYLVEGYTDVISMHQCGLENVVAASGTSLTEPQIRMIHRFTPNVTIIFDGDLPGIKAALRGINMVLEAGLNVKILLLPDGEDPDSFSKAHTSDEFIDYINKNEEDFIKFKTKLLLNEIGNDPIKKANLITDIVNTIAVIPNNITQAIYIKECSTMLMSSKNNYFGNKQNLKSNPNAKPEPPNYSKQVIPLQKHHQIPLVIMILKPIILYSTRKGNYMLRFSMVIILLMLNSA
ncbi:MAG: DNA primase [Bacteroidales bacterium]|nr:DNA primase [Bacteroidales bacterium]